MAAKRKAVAKKKAKKRPRKKAATDKQPKNRGHKNIEGHQWKPGQSGNPKGRPKRKSLEEVVRDLLAGAPKKRGHETRLDELADVLLSEVIDKKKQIAMKELLDRIWPKLNRVALGNDPEHPLTDPGPDLSKLSSADVRAYLKLRQKAAPDGGS